MLKSSGKDAANSGSAPIWLSKPLAGRVADDRIDLRGVSRAFG